MFKIDKTLVDNMNMNKSCIVITHKETVRKRAPLPAEMTLNDDKKMPPEVREKAQEFIRSANEQAKRIIESAYQQAGEMKEEARQQGLAQGLAEAADKHDKKMGAQLNELKTALAKLEAYRKSLFDALQSHVLGLSLDVAEKIINIQMEKDDKVFKELVKKAVDSLKKADDFTLTVSRGEYERFFKDSEDWLRTETGCGKYEAAGSPKMAQGSCVIESGNEIVDAGVTMQLGKMRQFLGEQVE